MTTTSPSVLVVGAGPAGLVTAIQLRRYGLRPRIVDRYAAPLKASKAAAMHARAMEYLHDIGCADPIVDGGQPVEILDLRTYYRDRVRLDFKRLDDTRFNYICDYPQWRTEEALLARYAELDGRLDRGVELTELTQDAGGVHVTLVDGDGEVERSSYDWVVGADGSKSTVRDLIGEEFKGEAYAEPWALADIELDWPLPRNEMTFCSDPDGICGIFPLPGDKTYRIAYTLNLDDDGQPIPPDESNLHRALRRTGVPGNVIRIGDFWTFNLAHRQTDRYRVDRVFLVGDAAHVHTPFGGQGLNVGVGDAFNLGWKLALALTGRAAPGLLETYEPERHKIGKEVVHGTHVGASLMLVRRGAKARARNALLGTLGRAKPFRARMTRRLAQVDQSYAAGPVAAHLRVGDRFADVAFFDGFHDRDRRAYDLLTSTRHTVVFTNPTGDPRVTAELARVAQATRDRYGDLVACALVSPHFECLIELEAFDDHALDRQRKFARLYGRRGAAHVVRPDMYYSGVALAADEASINGALDTTIRPVHRHHAGMTGAQADRREQVTA